MDPDTIAKLQAMFGGAPQGPPQGTPPPGMAQHLQPPPPQPAPPGGLMGAALGNGMNPPGPPPPTAVPYTAPRPPAMPTTAVPYTAPPPGQGFGGGSPMQGPPPAAPPQPGSPPPLSPPLINPQAAPQPSGAKKALQGAAGVLAEIGNMKQIPQFHDAQFGGYAHPQPGFAPQVGHLQMPKTW